MTRYILPKYILTNLRNLRGGDGLTKTSINWPRLLMILLSVILFFIILFVALGYFSGKKSVNTKCSAPDGCLLLSGVMNAQFTRKIPSKKIPSSAYQADYSLCTWLFVRSDNFTSKQGDGIGGVSGSVNNGENWTTVMYRGHSKVSYSQADGSTSNKDTQYSVQPGVWLNSLTNRLLIRWETIGRVNHVDTCDVSSCNTKKDSGNREHDQSNNSVRVCQTKGNSVQWSKEPDNHYSMNPSMNPPNLSCNGLKDGTTYNTSDSNPISECCVENIPVDRWFHLGIVVRTDSADVYIDGKMYKTVGFNSPAVIDPNSSIYLCDNTTSLYKNSNKKLGNSNNGFSGAITQLRYFSAGITPNDILKVYSWGPHPIKIPDIIDAKEDDKNKHVKDVTASDAANHHL